ncbi:MAG: hypothetical protein IJZ55_01980 [Lachnospiraceae bacterium]|nr:hypothetical protein [Lachnospiraceae bacterium]
MNDEVASFGLEKITKYGDILPEKVNRTLVLSFKSEPLYLEKDFKKISRYGGFSLDSHKR